MLKFVNLQTPLFIKSQNFRVERNLWRLKVQPPFSPELIPQLRSHQTINLGIILNLWLQQVFVTESTVRDIPTTRDWALMVFQLVPPMLGLIFGPHEFSTWNGNSKIPSANTTLCCGSPGDFFERHILYFCSVTYRNRSQLIELFHVPTTAQALLLKHLLKSHFHHLLSNQPSPLYRDLSHTPL